ncbi:MAG: hypothetical protein GYB31_17265 [Bacteroidetes bacterium]|nr:hypothetical protein [Bacteroidota bacterium]
MRYLFAITMFFGLLACQSDKPGEQTETANTPPADVQEQLPPPPAEGPRTQQTGAGRSVPVNMNDFIELRFSDADVKPGEQKCLEVTANSFQDVMSMQYTIQWDPEIIELAALGKFNLKDLTTNNFGAHKAVDGLLTFSWYDQNIQGISVADGTSIYQICFKGKGVPGSTSTVSFVETPVPFEISNKAGEVIRFEHHPGTVKVIE